MAGLNAIASKMKHLSSVSNEKARGRQVSVVYMDDNGNIDWPDNPNSSGVLVVPKPCKCLDEWQVNQER